MSKSYTTIDILIMLEKAFRNTDYKQLRGNKNSITIRCPDDSEYKIIVEKCNEIADIAERSKRKSKKIF